MKNITFVVCFFARKKVRIKNTTKNAGKTAFFKTVNALHHQQQVQFMSSKKPEKKQMILPRIIRMRDAPFYLGVNKNFFNSEIRPYLSAIKIGIQGIAFDRYEMDAWVDEYKKFNGKPANKTLESKPLWDAKKYPASSKGAKFGTSTRQSEEAAFAAALAQAISKKPKGF
jgi:hypothetical protein